MRSPVSLVAQRMVPLTLLGGPEVMTPDRGGKGHHRPGKRVSGVPVTRTLARGRRKAPGPRAPARRLLSIRRWPARRWRVCLLLC